MDIKTLNKLAKACRKLGISHLKTDECEITFSSDILPLQPKKRPSKLAPVNESLFSETDAMTQKTKELSDVDLLFWSSESTQ